MFNKNFEVFSLIPNEAGLSGIAITEQPAIEELFLKFEKENEKEDEKNNLFEFSADDEQIIFGAVMIPDKLLFRKAKGNFPNHYVTFTKDNIKKSAEIFLKEGLHFNDEHNKNVKIDANILQSFIVEHEDNKLGVPVGSWVIEARVNNKDQWNKIKENEMGFSYENSFKLAEYKYEFKINNNNNMSKLEKMVDGFKTFITEFIKDEPEKEEVEVVETPEVVEPEKEEIVEVEPEKEVVEEMVIEPEKVVEENSDETPEVEVEVETPEVEKSELDVEKLMNDVVAQVMIKLDEKLSGLNQKIEEFGNESTLKFKKEEPKPLTGYQRYKQGL